MHRETGRWGYCDGVLRPRIKIDRVGRLMVGFNGLLWHESLHAIERHAFLGLMLLGVGGVVALAIGLLVGLRPELEWFGYGSYAALALSGLAWVWWRRESEIRADVFSLEAVGAQEFFAFLVAFGMPRFTLPDGVDSRTRINRVGIWLVRRWHSWCYAKSVTARVMRATQRRERVIWNTSVSASKSSIATEASSSPTRPRSETTRPS